MNILFFVQHFFPSREIGARRPSEMAKYFIQHDITVEVISSTKQLTGDDANLDSLSSIPITPVPVPPDLISNVWRAIKPLLPQRSEPKHAAAPIHHLNATAIAAIDHETALQRLKRWYFSFESLFCGLKLWTLVCIPKLWTHLRKSKYDFVINSCPPMNTALLTRLFRRFAKHRFIWIIDLRDPFISPPQRTNASALRSALESLIENLCLKNCDAIVASSPGIARDIITRRPYLKNKISVIYNGYEGSPKVPQPPAQSKTLTLLSAGTIYYNRDPRPLLDALALAISEGGFPKTAFKLILLGNCENPSTQTVQEWISMRGLDDTVQLQSAVPPQAVQVYIDRSHLLVNFAQGQQKLIPAKTYEYMASGKESLTITESDSETAKVVIATACGPVVPANADAMKSVLLDRYKHYIENQGIFTLNTEAVREFARAEQNRKMLLLMISLAKSHPTS